MTGPHPPQELDRDMHSAWVDFVTKGDPGWPAYDEDSRATMVFDTRSHVESDPLAFERAVWP
jgi:carboxylesterase type B